MYQVEQKDYGYKLTFGDFIKLEEMQGWLEECRQKLKQAPKEFGVFVDMRTLKPLAVEVQDHMQEGQKLFKQKGMVRSVVVVESATTAMQFKRIAKETGIYAWERYLDASTCPNWEKLGIKWITQGVDPDQN